MTERISGFARIALASMAVVVGGCGGSSSSSSSLTGLSSAWLTTAAGVYKTLAQCVQVPGNLPAVGSGVLLTTDSDNSGYAGYTQFERVDSSVEPAAAEAPADASAVIRYTRFGGVNGLYTNGYFRQYQSVMAISPTALTLLQERQYNPCDLPIQSISYNGYTVPLTTGNGGSVGVTPTYQHTTNSYTFNQGSCHVTGTQTSSSSGTVSGTAGFVATYTLTPSSTTSVTPQVCRLDMPSMMAGSQNTLSLYLEPSNLVVKTYNTYQTRQVTVTALPLTSQATAIGLR